MLGNQRSIFKRSRYSQFGLQLWLDAAAVENFTYDANGKVSLAEDRTSYLRHFTQPTLANRPTYVLNAINTLPALRFNGVDQYMFFSDQTLSWLNNSAFTIIYVTTKTAKSSNSYIFGGTGTGARTNLAAGYLTPTTYRTIFGLDDINAIVPAVSAGLPELYAIRFDNTNNSREVRRNGVTVGLGASDGSLAGMSGQALGKYLTSFGQFDLGELFIYNRKLSDYEISQIERDLTSKWTIV